MERYVALFRREHLEGAVGVEFPDLPGCFSAGDSVEEARQMASEALRFHLDGLRAANQPIPSPRLLEDLLDVNKGADFLAFVEIQVQP